jgi:hypothetical protein
MRSSSSGAQAGGPARAVARSTWRSPATGRCRRTASAGGKHVLWIGPDYKQLNTIWVEDIEPRFQNAAGCTTNQNEFTASLGDSRLVLRSAENPKAIRGMGKGVGGVIIDEAAHLDMERLLTEVVMPILLDEGGWLIVPSTPNAAHDGFVDDVGNKRTPSYFNLLCQRQLAGGQRGWSQFHHTAQDNPKISPEMFQQLVDLYPESSIMLQQEVFGQLLTGGTGFAFPELDAKLHQRETPIERIVETVAGCDWGYTAPGWIGAISLTPVGAHVHHEFPYNGPLTKENPQRRDPEQVGYDCGREWLRALREQEIPSIPEMMFCDSAMADVTDGTASIMSMMQDGFTRALGHRAPTLVIAPKGKGSRRARKSVLHTLLRAKQLWVTVKEEDGPQLVTVEHPRLTFHPRCTTLWRTVSSLPLDPKDPEDVDTTANDHPYDGLTYCLIASFPEMAHRTPRSLPDVRDKLSRKADKDYDAVVAAARRKPLTAAKHLG